MFSCGAEGEFSLLGFVLASQVADSDVDEDGVVLVHLTVCREHLREARAWLQERALESVDTYRTEVLAPRLQDVLDGLLDETGGTFPLWHLERTG
jgi:hypothetical protein